MKLRQPMPELTGEKAWLNGEVTREQLIGEKPTLIHFWSISCHLCKEAMPQVLTPKIMEDSYDRLHLDRRVLSRNSEVGGTLTSGMVPWSDNGIYMAGILGVSTFSYLPFMWLSFVAIGLAIIYGYTGKFIWYTKNNTVKAEKLG